MKKAEVVRYFGSVRATAEALRIKSPAVSQWGDDVPPLRAYQIKEIMRQNDGCPLPSASNEGAVIERKKTA